MTAIRAIIIDDEPSSSETLVWDLEGANIPVEVIGVANDPEEGLQLIEKHTPDILFLDIEMPKMNGFELLKRIDKIDFSVIFTTAYDQYAIRAFKVNALDYLLKPITQDQLENALRKYKEEKANDEWDSKLAMLQEMLDKNQLGFNKIAWPTSEGIEFIASSDILRCESESNYTHIYVSDGSTLLVSKTLGVVEDMIGSDTFLRVHKSHLINLNFIKRFVKSDGGYIVMENGAQVPVSRRRRDDLTNILT